MTESPAEKSARKWSEVPWQEKPTPINRLFCSDFIEAGWWTYKDCCGSCHEDDEEGYAEMSEADPYNTADVATVCCALMRVLDVAWAGS